VRIDVSKQAHDFRQSTFIMYNCARLSKLFSHYEQSVQQGLYPPLPQIEKIDFSLLREKVRVLTTSTSVIVTFCIVIITIHHHLYHHHHYHDYRHPPCIIITIIITVIIITVIIITVIIITIIIITIITVIIITIIVVIIIITIITVIFITVIIITIIIITVITIIVVIIIITIITIITVIFITVIIIAIIIITVIIITIITVIIITVIIIIITIIDEWNLLLRYVMTYPSAVRDAIHGFLTQPRHDSLVTTNINKICCFLLEMSQDFSSYYGRTHILGEPRPHLFPTMFARLYLLKAIQQVIKL
ncbi:hypothetical protein QZH41_017213, partial [Actinostola sp. cb2023]